MIYTYREYLGWNDIRCELIEGSRKIMAGVSEWHSDVSWRLTCFLNKVKENYGRSKYFVFHAPVDVILFPEEEFLDSKTVVQPDFGICLKEKRRGRLIIGAPEFVIEITSSNPSYDYKDKFEIYQKAGVLEYWIISPKEGIVTVFIYNKEKQTYNDAVVYEIGVGENKIIKSSVIEDIEIDIEELFDFSDLI